MATDPNSVVPPVPAPGDVTAPAPVDTTATAPAPVDTTATAPAPVDTTATAPAPVDTTATAPAPVADPAPTPATEDAGPSVDDQLADLTARVVALESQVATFQHPQASADQSLADKVSRLFVHIFGADEQA